MGIILEAEITTGWIVWNAEYIIVLTLGEEGLPKKVA